MHPIQRNENTLARIPFPYKGFALPETYTRPPLMGQFDVAAKNPYRFFGGEHISQ